MDNDVGTQPIRGRRLSERLIQKKRIRMERLMRCRLERLYALNPHTAIEGFLPFWLLSANGVPSGPMDFIDMVQSHGPAVARMKMEAGMTPQNYACLYGWGEYAELLVARGADAGATDGIGRRTLWLAVDSGCMRCLRAVLGGGLGDPTFLRANRIDAYLERSVSHGNEEIVRDLLAAGAGVGAWAEDGRRALYIAVRDGHMGIVCMLVEAGVDPGAIVDGVSVIASARLHGHHGIAQWLSARLAAAVVASDIGGGSGDYSEDTGGSAVQGQLSSALK